MTERGDRVRARGCCTLGAGPFFFDSHGLLLLSVGGICAVSYCLTEYSIDLPPVGDLGIRVVVAGSSDSPVPTLSTDSCPPIAYDCDRHF